MFLGEFGRLMYNPHYHSSPVQNPAVRVWILRACSVIKLSGKVSNSCPTLNGLIKPDRNDSCVKSGSKKESDIGRATPRLGLSYQPCLIQRSSGRQWNIKLSGSCTRVCGCAPVYSFSQNLYSITQCSYF